MVSVGFMGSKYTRLLKHGEAGHTVAMVEVSWIDRPCGSSSRCITLRTPPYFGVSARAGSPAAIATAAAHAITAVRHRFIGASPPAVIAAPPWPGSAAGSSYLERGHHRERAPSDAALAGAGASPIAQTATASPRDRRRAAPEASS